MSDPFAGASFGTHSVLANAQPYVLPYIPAGNPAPSIFAYNSGDEMTQFTSPMGGILSWAYQSFTYNGGITVREVSSRSMNDAAASLTNSWTLSDPSSDNNLTYHSSLDLLDNGAASHKIYGAGIPLSGSSLVLPTSYMEESSAGPTVLLQKTFTWTQDAAGNAYVGTAASTLNPGTGSAATSSTVQTLDIYGNLLQQQLYDYPGNPVQSNNSTPFKTYNFTYLTNSNYTSRYIRNRMTQATVTGYGGTITLSTTTYDGTTLGALLDPTQGNGSYPSYQQMFYHDPNYGVSLTYRGNPTATVQMGTTTNTAYLITGVPYLMQDGDAMTVSIGTALSTSYAMPSVVTPNSNGNLATSMTYTSSFALASVTGANGVTQSASYDYFNRPLTSTSADGAVTNYTYTSTSQNAPNTQTATISTTVSGTTTTQWKTTTYDGFGRVTRVQTGHDGTAVTNVDTQYGACGCSPLGKATASSMPYAPGATVYWTTNTYDSSGRTLTQTKPDGSVTHTSYSGNAVTVTDPAGKWKTYYSDSTGGLTTVVEPDPNNASPSSNPVTYYYLNGAGQIVVASVQRSGVSQNRSFAWSGSNLASSTTPEAGTVTYQYDGNHHVTQRTDAKGQQTQYSYDSYERLTQVRHYNPGPYGSLQEATNQRVNYTYDQNPLDPGNYVNSWGRLTGVNFQESTGLNVEFGYYYSYNQAGRVTADTLEVGDFHGNLLAAFQSTATWDNQGRMTNMTYPSGTSLNYQYDSMSRLSGITSNNPANPGYPTTLATASYTAANQLSSLTVGPGGPYYTESRSYNSLMQLTSLVTNSFSVINNIYTATPMVSMQYNYTAGQNNGRVSSTTDNVLGETVNYTYDMWNRLKTAAATNGAWGESYTFDGFGNLTGKTPTAGSAPAMNSPVNLATNQPTSENFDANGNLNPLYGSSYPTQQYQYAWDIENRLVGMAGATYFAYDPWGKRVWKEIPATDGSANSTGEIYFYGITGQKLETYSFSHSDSFSTTLEGINVYFGGKLVQSKGAWIATDKMGTVRADSNGVAMSYFPFGEERTSTADGRDKFATYFRDGLGQDYAEQRYYSSNSGAFWSPDPGGIKTANPNNPSSWNRYAYTKGNPIGRFDRHGLDDCDPDEGCDCDDPCNPCEYSEVAGMPGGVPLAAGCIDPGPGPGPAPPPPSPPDCDAVLEADIANYLGAYKGGSSPLNTWTNIDALVQAGMTYDVDPRFIVALSVAETQAGTNMNWGPYNAWNIISAKPPNASYSSWGQAITSASNLADQYISGNGLTNTASFYKEYEHTKNYGVGLRNLNSALKSMGGATKSLTDPCNPANSRPPNQ